MLLQVLHNNAENMQHYIDDTDVTIVLLQEGVYLLPQLIGKVPEGRLFVLESDWLASGLEHQITNEHALNLISPTQWVAMAAEHFNVLTLQS
jgi:sulfur transfer complex TusBCD TusB component (DsrH family)